MSAPRVRIEDHAAEEFDAAADWYHEQRPGLGAEFVEAVNAAMDRLAENPGLAGPVWALEGSWWTGSPTRSCSSRKRANS